MSLAAIFQAAAAQSPDAVALRAGGHSVTYGALDALANRTARALSALGVGRGDRVGICLPKSAAAVASMQAVLRLGAVYVPLDPLSPPARWQTIAKDCKVAALITSVDAASVITVGELFTLPCLCVDGSWNGPHWDDVLALPAAPVIAEGVSNKDLAYILYTSGSTGKPKGVCLTHENALAFIHWAAGEIAATSEDRFVSHAPFHFDLSVLDLYVAFLAGARVVFVDDAASFNARLLVDLVVRERLTIWYSVPSAICLMMDQGGLLEREDVSLRVILFAGEPFPIQQFRRLYERFPRSRFLNLYGPTETNVCTFYEVKEPLPPGATSIPIGRACSGNRVWAVKEDGTPTEEDEGMLMVEGPTVMHGYWGQDPHGPGPYATGDTVRYLGDDGYAYVGRRDQMVKVRGHRIEIGEIEACLRDHPDVADVVVGVHRAGVDARIVAFVVPRGQSRISLLEIKRHCAERLPRYMIVDRLRVIAEVPKTRNGKTDRAALLAGLDAEG